MYLVVAILVTVLPIAYGVFLLVAKLNVFDAVLVSADEFTWFQIFNAINCLPQVFFGVVLVVCIFLARRQLR